MWPFLIKHVKSLGFFAHPPASLVTNVSLGVRCRDFDIHFFFSVLIGPTGLPVYARGCATPKGSSSVQVAASVVETILYIIFCSVSLHSCLTGFLGILITQS